MHEFGIAEAILTAVEDRADGRRVRRARVYAGAMLRVTEPAVNHAFAVVAEGSLAEGAQVELVIVPVQLICRACGQTAASAAPLATCPECGGVDIETEGGDDLVLESIQIAKTGH
ncbi:hydrogenase maturation nickel metallochaperone HypA [Streptosporangium sp. NPDC051023]|uniref:hydrogenase maturation nickel metallochaperone HypA/HybF n=1 Tax=Streptosporangium sp. NPDC051023 TaxID=3155410 RepID=UPI00344B89C6